MPLTLTLFQGEGTDPAVYAGYIDLKFRADLRLEKHEDLLPFPLSLRERAGVRGAFLILVQSG